MFPVDPSFPLPVREDTRDSDVDRRTGRRRSRRAGRRGKVGLDDEGEEGERTAGAGSLLI